MKTIDLPQLAWHGVRPLTLEVPENWAVETREMAGHARSRLAPAAIREAIAECPFGGVPIRELARGKREVAIITNDMTRLTRAYDIVPHVLEELAAAGVADSAIRFVIALGCHGSLSRSDMIKKLGEDVVCRFPVFNHNPFGNCQYVGTTKLGVRVSLNSEIMGCDLKISIASTTPHVNMGYGGGGKIVLPGLASYETVSSMHRLSKHLSKDTTSQLTGEFGRIEGNPLRETAEEAALMCGLDFDIETLFNNWGETCAVFAGSLHECYAAAVAEASRHFLTERAQDKDIVIANAFAKANEATLGILNASPSVKRTGGDIVLIANAPDGQVVHYLMGPTGTLVEAEQKLRVRLPSWVNRLIVYSEYPDPASRGYYELSDKVHFVSEWGQVLRLLEAAHLGGADVAVYPMSEVQYCR